MSHIVSMTPITLTGAGAIGLGAMRDSSASRASASLRDLTPTDRNVSPQMMKKIDAAAMEFESVFLSQMMEESFRGVSSNPFSQDGEEGGFADDTFRSFMITEYGRLMARAGGIGLAQNIKQSMLSMQEVSHAAR